VPIDELGYVPRSRLLMAEVAVARSRFGGPVSRTEDILAAHPTQPAAAALTDGFGDALLAGAAFAAGGALLAAVLIRRRGLAPAAAASREPAETPSLERAA
jgi:hypothetical protein